METQNTSWGLEEFIDSLVVELDKTRETLAVKAINKPLSYTVKELAIDLNAFPSYDGDAVRFVTAQPGQQGASKVTIQLGSITDQQVRATSKIPGRNSEVNLDKIAVPKQTKKTLRKLGINSDDDLKQVQRKNVDLQSVTDSDINYSNLANEIARSRRGQSPPVVSSVGLSLDTDEGPTLDVKGSNLAVNPAFKSVAVVNGVLAHVLSGNSQALRLKIGPEHRFGASNEVVLTVDPFAVIKLNVKAKL